MRMNGSNETESKRKEIISYLKSYILENGLKEDDPLPSENTLAVKMSANRNTVRSALAALKAQGIIYSHKGKGFFVAERPRPLVYQHDNFLGFSEILNKGSRNFTSEALWVRRGFPSAKEQQKLELSASEEVYYLKQLRTFGGKKLAVCMSVIPARHVPELEKHTDDFRGVNNIFLNVYHFPHPMCKWVYLEASLPTQEDAELLEITENMPILQQENLFEISGIGPIEYFIVRARGDMFHFSMEFR